MEGVPFHLSYVKKEADEAFLLVRFGGGGNNDTQCQEMSREWIYDEELFRKTIVLLWPTKRRYVR